MEQTLRLLGLGRSQALSTLPSLACFAETFSLCCCYYITPQFSCHLSTYTRVVTRAWLPRSVQGSGNYTGRIKGALTVHYSGQYNLWWVATRGKAIAVFITGANFLCVCHSVVLCQPSWPEVFLFRYSRGDVSHRTAFMVNPTTHVTDL